jgi:LytS/YehU family sensor histidine kinase
VTASSTRLLPAIFGALIVISTAQGYLARRAMSEPMSLLTTLGISVLTWIVWFAAAPGIIALGRRFDFAPGRRLLSAVVHLAALLLTYAASVLAMVWISVTFLMPDETLTWEAVRMTLLGSTRVILALFTYLMLLGLDRLLRHREALQARDVNAARLESLATQARLDALASRLQPHFLFNALQSVSALVDTHPAAARTMLAQIGDLLRDTLHTPEDGDLPLREELELLGRYLAIEQTRFADRLRIEVVVAPEVAETRVPRFLLQPLAENALRHGLAPVPEGGTLRVTVARDGDCARLTVWNDGAPLPAVVVEGVGLATTRERLAARFGTAASLVVRTAPGGGTAAVIEVPA